MNNLTVFDPTPSSLGRRFTNEPSVLRHPESALRRMEAVGWEVGERGCHNWRGQLDGKRAKFNLPEGNRNAARVLWLLVRGNVPRGMQLAHQCHNATCVNLDHLEIQTPQENASANRGKPHPGRPGRKPSISPHIDKAIRQLRNAGYTVSAIASVSGLSVDVVRGSLVRTSNQYSLTDRSE